MTSDPASFGARPPGARPSTTPPPFRSTLAQRPPAPGPRIGSPLVSPAPLPVPPRAGRTAPIWMAGLLVLVLVGLLAYFLNAIGPGASIIGMVLALIPLTVVLLAVRIVDRWEPEPLSLLILAVAWGAIGAVGIALGVDIAITIVLGVDDSPMRDAFASVVQAPIVEELAKGFGVYLIFLVGRRAFDGPIDGIVYGALVGAGFAFTENIQYFAISFLEGGIVDTSVTFFMRGILSPFAHVMFTSVTGFALGLAARRGASSGRAVGPWLLGMVGAMALHAIWNGSAVFGDFFGLYLMLQVPLFVGFIVSIISLRREEARVTRARLADYAKAGWFTVQEVDMLATSAGRRAGLRWAQSVGGDRSAVMKRFISDATALAAARQRAISGRDPKAREDETVLLTRVTAARAAIFAP